MGTKRRMDCCTPRPKHGGGTWWHKVGSAIENDEGRITIYLDSVPLMDKERGNVVIMLFEQRDKEEQQEERPRGTTATKKPAAARQSRSNDIDDEIPF